MSKAIRALLVLALLLPAAACGNDMEDARQALTGTGDALRQAGTATIHFEVHLADSLGSTSVNWAGTSKVKYGDPDVSDTRFERSDVHFPVNQAHAIDLREIIVGPTRYQQSTKLRLAAGKTWVKLTTGTDVVYGTQLANPDLGVIDPAPYLQMLAGYGQAFAYAADLKKTETIDGVQTHRYNTVCTFGEYDCDADALPPAFTSLFPEGEVQIGLWLDSDDRPRKMTLDGTLNGAPDPLTGQQANIRLKATMTLGDFGKPVQVTAPPAGQTTTRFTVQF